MISSTALFLFNSCQPILGRLSQLSETKQVKFFQLDKELYQHPAWMRFVGKNAAQKQRYIQRKFLPLQLQQLSQEYEQKNKQIDKNHQRSWRNLEAAYYEKLETIEFNITTMKFKSNSITPISK